MIAEGRRGNQEYLKYLINWIGNLSYFTHNCFQLYTCNTVPIKPCETNDRTED